MFENAQFLEMAKRAKRSVWKVVLLLYLITFVNRISCRASIYDSANHYWPMRNISDNTSLDTKSLMHAEMRNGARLMDTSIFGPAVMLDGVDDWIDLELMMSDRCTNFPSECRHGFTIAFWLYHMGGEFLLCTGTYRGSTQGPGIEFTFQQEDFVIKVTTVDRTWRLTSKLISTIWVHVAFQWTATEGINLYLNGTLAQKTQQEQEVSLKQPTVARGWSIGKYNQVFKLDRSGHFGIAHLVLWRRELTNLEIKTALYETLLPENLPELENPTTDSHIQPTSPVESPEASSKTRSVAVRLHSNLYWSAVAALPIASQLLHKLIS